MIVNANYKREKYIKTLHSLKCVIFRVDIVKWKCIFFARKKKFSHFCVCSISIIYFFFVFNFQWKKYICRYWSDSVKLMLNFYACIVHKKRELYQKREQSKNKKDEKEKTRKIWQKNSKKKKNIHISNIWIQAFSCGTICSQYISIVNSIPMIAIEQYRMNRNVENDCDFD